MMSRLIAKGIIRSYSMRQRRIAAALKPPNGIASNCDVCGGLMFNTQRYMDVNDAYFTASTIRFWIWTSWIGYLSIDRAVAAHFPLPM